MDEFLRKRVEFLEWEMMDAPRAEEKAAELLELVEHHGKKLSEGIFEGVVRYFVWTGRFAEARKSAEIFESLHKRQLADDTWRESEGKTGRKLEEYRRTGATSFSRVGWLDAYLDRKPAPKTRIVQRIRITKRGITLTRRLTQMVFDWRTTRVRIKRYEAQRISTHVYMEKALILEDDNQQWWLDITNISPKYEVPFLLEKLVYENVDVVEEPTEPTSYARSYVESVLGVTALCGLAELFNLLFR